MTSLDNFLSTEIRHQIEERYYAQVNAQSRFEILQSDPEFMNHMDRHVALYSDHGVVHVRDVSQHLLAVLKQVNGVLVPQRSLPRLARMQGYGVLVAYLHDIGMTDFSNFGRTMHPEFASQAAFDSELDSVVQAIWEQNSGNIPWYLLNLSNKGLLEQPPLTVLRELLALSMCHSKSKVPITALNDPQQLRTLMITTISTKLPYLFHLQSVQKAEARLSVLPPDDPRRPACETAVAQAIAACDQFRHSVSTVKNPHLARYYHDPHQDAFRWLISAQPELQAFVADVIDTLRALRCADALRQRGTVLKTSGGYEIFINQRSGNAVYALRHGDEQLFLFESPDPVSAGEANIASSELDPVGDLRISFARGAFKSSAATQNAVRSSAIVVNDIQKDIIGSFQRAETGPTCDGLKLASEMCILLEETDDNLDFAFQVQQQLATDYPELTARVQVVPSLRLASLLERTLYRTAVTITWSEAERRDVLDRIGQAGHRVDPIDLQSAFENVRLATITAGQMLIEANSEAAFVYIPLEPGLRVVPLGGYQTFWVEAWMPLGLTGVVRGAVRNASVVASRKLRLLMIPRTVYLTHWHHTHSLTSFRQLLKENQKQVGQTTQKLMLADKVQLLQSVSLFATVEDDMLLSLAAACEEVMVAPTEQLFAAGHMGQSLYIIAEGRVSVQQDGRLLAELGEGEVFGEMALLTPEPRMATVTAVVPTRLIRLDREIFNQLVDAHSQIARGVIAALSQRLRAITLTYTRSVKNDSA